MAGTGPLKLPQDLLDHLLDQIQVSREIPPEKLVGTIDRLEFLYSLAIFHKQYSSRQMRSNLDLATNDLLREIRKLQTTLRNTAWMAEPLRLEAVHTWIENSRSEPSSTETRSADLVMPSDSIQQLETPLNELTEALVHLQDTAKEYDLLGNDSALLEWIEQGSSEMGQLVRAELSTYFQKGGGIKPDTLIVRHIAKLYEYAFDLKFSVTSSVGKVSYLNKVGNLDLQKLTPGAASRENISRPSQYEGPALRFACAVINCLGLQNIVFPLEARNPDDDPAVTNYKENHNRMLALQGREVPDKQLADRIGHIWKNDAKRKRQASSPSDLDISFDASDD